MARRSISETRRLVALLLILLAVAVAGVWWQFLRTPRVDTITSLETRAAQLSSRNEQTRRTVVTLGAEGAESAIQAYSRQAEVLDRLVPADTTPSRLIGIITSGARTYDVSVTELRPLERGTLGGFTTTGYQLKLTGRYHDIGALITQLLSLDRLTRVRTVNVRAVAPAGGAAGLSAVAAGGEWRSEATLELLELGRPLQQPTPRPAAGAARPGAPRTAVATPTANQP